MKKLIPALVLLLCTRESAFAQNTFDLPQNYINRQFYFDFPGGNEIRLRFASIRDLYHIGSLDSTFRVCMEDLAPLKDSLEGGLAPVRVDYVDDSAGRKLIRIRHYPLESSGFLVQHGTVSALKLEQDTLHLLLPVGNDTRRYEIIVLVNDLSELPDMLASGLDGKLDTIRDASWAPGLSRPNNWNWKEGTDRRLHLDRDSGISVDHLNGSIDANNDRVALELDAGLSNYKNYFVLSFYLGVKVLFNSSNDLLHKDSKFKYFLCLGWEPLFFFQNTSSSLTTYRNDMITLYFSRMRKAEALASLHPRPHFGLGTSISIGYLVNKRGPFMAPNTVRIGLGAAHFGNNIQVQPLVYFNNFFNGVTPGINAMVGF